IEKSFHLTDKAFLNVVLINIAVVFLLAIPVGWWSDRTNRVRLVWVSALVAVVFSFATGLAVGLLMLVIVRIGNGAGFVANDPVHTSLLTDYYPPQNRPEAISIHRSAPSIGRIAAPPIAGLLGLLLGWRAGFFILAIPVLAMVWFAVRMKEPVRGATDSPEEALEAALERPVSFSRAVRSLYP